MDPAIGIKKYDYIEFNQIFTGNILKLNPVGKIVKYQKNNYFKDLVLKMIKQNVKVFIIILILSIIIFILSLINISNVKEVLENNYELKDLIHKGNNTDDRYILMDIKNRLYQYSEYKEYMHYHLNYYLEFR